MNVYRRPTMKTPYEILGISNEASMDEIKYAFREKAKKTHPDLNQNDTILEEKFIEVTNAYKILCDPILKRKLDYDILENSDLNFWNSHEKFDSQILHEVIKELIVKMQTQAESHKRNASKALWKGLAWLFGGLLITLVSYLSAVNNGGGTYIVTYGAIIFGALQAFRGFAVYNEINSSIANYEKYLWNKFDEIIASDFVVSDDNEFYNYSTSQNETHNMSSNRNSKTTSNTPIFNKCESDVQQVNNKVPFLVWLLIIVIVIFIISSMDSNSSDFDIVQQPVVQETTEGIQLPKNYLSPKDSLELNSQINYDQALSFMSNQYSRDEINYIIGVLNKLDYYLAENMYNELIAAVVHFQKANNLEVDGMVGPMTMKELSKSLAIKEEGATVKYRIKFDSNVVKEYGWSSNKVENFVYFVSYDFDYDNSYNNGYYLYPYEVNLKSQEVIAVTDSLFDKYRRLGFID